MDKKFEVKSVSQKIKLNNPQDNSQHNKREDEEVTGDVSYSNYLSCVFFKNPVEYWRGERKMKLKIDLILSGSVAYSCVVCVCTRECGLQTDPVLQSPNLKFLHLSVFMCVHVFSLFTFIPFLLLFPEAVYHSFALFLSFSLCRSCV